MNTKYISFGGVLTVELRLSRSRARIPSVHGGLQVSWIPRRQKGNAPGVQIGFRPFGKGWHRRLVFRPGIYLVWEVRIPRRRDSTNPPADDPHSQAAWIPCWKWTWNVYALQPAICQKDDVGDDWRWDEPRWTVLPSHKGNACFKRS